MNSNPSNSVQAFWVGLGSLSAFALGIVSSVILSRYFDKAEYGTYKQIIYVYNTLLIIFSAGLPRVFAYYLPRYSVVQGKDIVWKISKVLFLGGLVFSTFLFSFSGLIANILKNPELEIGLKYFSPVPALLLPTLGIEGIFSSYKKTIYIAIYNTLSRVIMLLFILLPVIYLKGTYLTAIYGWLVASFITFLMAFLFKNIPFKNKSKEKSDLKIKDVFHYSLPLMAASVAGIAMRSADQFYISRYFGTEVFAEFSNGFIQLPFVGMITSAVSVVLMPAFSKMIHDKMEVDKITELWQSALLRSAVLIYPILIFFIFSAHSIVVLLFSNLYFNSIIYFQIAMIVNFFNIIVFAPLLLSLGKTKFYFRIHLVFAVIIWIGEFVIVKLFNSPIAIAAFSVLISVSLIMITLFKVSTFINISFSKLFPIKQFSVIILHTLIIIFVVFITNKFLSNFFESWILLIINFITYSILLLTTSKWFKINYLSAVRPLLKGFGVNL